MKRTEEVKAWKAGVLAACVLMLAFGCRAQAQTALYSTDFEAAEGYLPDLTLTGQKGWVGSGATDQ